LNILITGGSGFLGSHLVRRLLKGNNQVTVIDNLHTGRLENLSDFIDLDNFHFVNADIEAPINVKDNFDGIFNLACPASPLHYQQDPVKTLRTNVLGAVNVLEFAKKSSARVLQFSTSEVYGDPDVSPQREDYLGRVNQIGIRACYDEGKRAAETLFYDYHRQYGVDIRVARIFNTYGENMSVGDGRVVSNFCVQALRQEKATIFGDGTQTRSFCYVDDLIEGIIRLFYAEEDCHLPVNLGNPQEISMNQLVEEIRKLVPNFDYEFQNLPQDDPRQRKPDIQRAKQLLNWVPATSLQEGLARTIEYFRSELALPSSGK
jgi:UDP-glucuronate decarboxylase